MGEFVFSVGGFLTIGGLISAIAGVFAGFSTRGKRITNGMVQWGIIAVVVGMIVIMAIAVGDPKSLMTH